MAVTGINKIRAIAETILIAAFLVAICLPVIVMWAAPEPAADLPQDEAVVPMPQFTADTASLVAFPERFKAFLASNIGFRDHMIFLNGYIKVKLLEVTSSEFVVLGKDGWFFTNRQNIFDDYRGLKPFTEKQLLAWQREIESRRDWLAARGIRYLVIITPESFWTYPEYTPDNRPRTGGPSRLDQFYEHMQKYSDVEALDLRPALWQAKPRGPLYYKTDPHWTALGGYFAYVEIFKTLQQWFPGLEAEPASSFQLQRSPRGAGALARWLGLAPVLKEMRVSFKSQKPQGRHRVDNKPGHRPLTNIEVAPDDIVVLESPNAEIPRVVAFRDSYATALIPYISEHFGRVVYVRTGRFEFNPDIVAQEQPDLVIQESVSRVLMNDELPRMWAADDYSLDP